MSPTPAQPHTCVFIVSAPSGSGKSTLVRELFTLVPGLEFSISYTTRAPRGSEQNGREYFFVDRATFEGILAAGGFLEHAEVFGHYYGTAASFLVDSRRRGHDLVLDIDVQGAAMVRQRVAEAVGIFIAPPDRATLARRLQHRGLDKPEVVAERLETASREIAAYNDYEYVIINDQLEISVEQLQAVVLTERARARPGDSSAELPGDAAHWQQVAASCRRGVVAPALAPVLKSFGLSA
ncbi:MAG: guanylate kinase [Terriglobales bacterium]